MLKKKTVKEKFNTVIERNTFYFFNREFEERYEGHINSLNESLLVLKNDLEMNGLRKKTFETLLENNENGLDVILALTGFSKESFLRLITLVRIVDNKRLEKLTFRKKWDDEEESTEKKEWGKSRLLNCLRTNAYFRKGVVNLFFEGATLPFLAETLPLFELKKLSISKLNFNVSSMIDTLVRYKEKGSYSGKMNNNPELVISSILDKLDIKYFSGDLPILKKLESSKKRTMDFIIPNQENPRIIIESSFLVTTSSGQGDKSKTEISMEKLIKDHYPKAKFIGFVDGIGWYVRKEDLKRMVEAYEEVFTFQKSELDRFEQFLRKELLADAK